MVEYEDALERTINEVVKPNAGIIDASAAYPRAAIDALGQAGILGLTVAESVGGGGLGLRQAAGVVQRLSGACGSTAMVVLMHYAGTVVIENHGDDETRNAIGRGQHLTTLAFSENGSRSHFWAPRGSATATEADESVRLDANKSWVTSAGEADSYVWSSRPLASDGPMTLWLVPRDAPGLTTAGQFDGLGLRGNRSTPMSASGTIVSRETMLGEDGKGLDLALSEVLPWFLVMSAAFSVGLMEVVVSETGQHLRKTRLEHLDQSLAEQPLARVDHARMRVRADEARALLNDALDAIERGSDDGMLRVLEVKLAAGEAAIAVTDLAMKVCGGSAFRKELGIERLFRDARAARVMAPTSDALLDFIGRTINGLPLL